MELAANLYDFPSGPSHLILLGAHSRLAYTAPALRQKRDKQDKALVIPLSPQRDYNLCCGAAFGWRAHVGQLFPRLTDTVPREASFLQDTSSVTSPRELRY